LTRDEPATPLPPLLDCNTTRRQASRTSLTTSQPTTTAMRCPSTLHQLLRKPPLLSPRALSQPPTRLFLSSTSPPRPHRVLNRLPTSLRPYTIRLRNAPVTHVVSFLILHEMTAVVPLVGLAGLFHCTGWVPDVSREDRMTRVFRSWARAESGRHVRIAICIGADL